MTMGSTSALRSSNKGRAADVSGTAARAQQACRATTSSACPHPPMPSPSDIAMMKSTTAAASKICATHAGEAVHRVLTRPLWAAGGAHSLRPRQPA